ncbi:ATP-dependent RNA helicase RhlE [Candidatus Marinamargulisbacteria bacterium SCGC AG-343-D04]|nr:ATP-dependent RNA helicase RhlE [Candidatus Marinamargulisbacteria bacterium SCGC AG-343-D04]
MSFKELNLLPELLQSIEKQGYTEPTPIQAKAIPHVLKGKDVLAGAQTGTGKTAAFTLPLLHRLTSQKRSKSHLPRALILTPTRELAAQVGKSVDTYGKGLSLRSAIVFGGVGINPQKKRLRQGVEIVIGTPGRLLDLCKQNSLDLSRIEVLILDEADRMLDMGFINDIKKIIRLVPKKRQTLFFSATYSKQIKSLADTILVNPELVEVARENMAADTVTQSVYHVPKSRKSDLLVHLIKEGDWNQILVFTRTKHGADRVSKQLNKEGIVSVAIHGNKSQAARTRALADFKAWKVRVLVATDVAARGLDISLLPHVVNYDLSEVPEDYVHRIGRTGRAGSSGEAISFASGDEIKLLRAIERLIKKKITVNSMDGFSEHFKVLDKEDARNKEGHTHERRTGDRRRDSYRDRDENKNRHRGPKHNRGTQNRRSQRPSSNSSNRSARRG